MERIMKRVMLVFAIYLGFLLASAVSMSGEWEKLKPEQKKDLEAGKAVYEYVKTENADGTTGGYARSLILINAPIKECWKIFCEFDKHHLYFPRQKGTVVIESSKTQALIQKIFEFYVLEISYYIKYTIDHEKHRINYDLDKSRPHDLEETSGFFRFEKKDDKTTLFIYAVTKVETGLKVPGFIQNYITSRDLPNVAEHVKRRIESGGTWKKK